MLAVGNEELKGKPSYKKGTKVVRLSDGKLFTVDVGIDAETGKETNILGTVKDGVSSIVCGVGGKLLEGWYVYETCPHCGQSTKG
jgi:hypothetical protein